MKLIQKSGPTVTIEMGASDLTQLFSSVLIARDSIPASHHAQEDFNRLTELLNELTIMQYGENSAFALSLQYELLNSTHELLISHAQNCNICEPIVTAKFGASLETLNKVLRVSIDKQVCLGYIHNK